jgi:hypothetical protein
VGRARAAVAAAVILAAGGAAAAVLLPARDPVAALVAPRPVALPPAPPANGLLLGLTEQHPGLLWDGGADPERLARWRERVDALDPPLLRLMVDWAQLQPEAGVPVDWARPGDGCMRGLPPCMPTGGIREWLQAAAARGAEVLVSVYGTPAWAAEPPRGCERAGTEPRSRAPRADALPAYRALLRSLLDLAEREGAPVRWLSPWNEPNGPFFLAGQREACDPASPSRAARLYTRLFRAAATEARGRAGLVVGELAGYERPSPLTTGVRELVGALPRDVACGAAIAGAHAYHRPALRFDPVTELRRALDAHGCDRRLPIWVTETGPAVRAGPAGAQVGRSVATCRAYHRGLRRWLADPRVGAAFQYTFRDDPAYPSGLADAGLSRTWPSYRLLRAWAGRADPLRAPPDPC